MKDEKFNNDFDASLDKIKNIVQKIIDQNKEYKKQIDTLVNEKKNSDARVKMAEDTLKHFKEIASAEFKKAYIEGFKKARSEDNAGGRTVEKPYQKILTNQN